MGNYLGNRLVVFLFTLALGLLTSEISSASCASLFSETRQLTSTANTPTLPRVEDPTNPLVDLIPNHFSEAAFLKPDPYVPFSFGKITKHASIKDPRRIPEIKAAEETYILLDIFRAQEKITETEFQQMSERVRNEIVNAIQAINRVIETPPMGARVENYRESMEHHEVQSNLSVDVTGVLRDQTPSLSDTITQINKTLGDKAKDQSDFNRNIARAKHLQRQLELVRQDAFNKLIGSVPASGKENLFSLKDRITKQVLELDSLLSGKRIESNEFLAIRIAISEAILKGLSNQKERKESLETEYRNRFGLRDGIEDWVQHRMRLNFSRDFAALHKLGSEIRVRILQLQHGVEGAKEILSGVDRDIENAFRAAGPDVILHWLSQR